jgi:hypothetical protein
MVFFSPSEMYERYSPACSCISDAIFTTGNLYKLTASCIELPGHIVLVSIIHRTISLWLSSTEVDDEEGPGDQSRSGLPPHELRRELVEDMEDMALRWSH